MLAGAARMKGAILPKARNFINTAIETGLRVSEQAPHAGTRSLKSIYASKLVKLADRASQN